MPSQGIEDAIVAFLKHPKLKDTDSVVVVIMSHGKLGAVVGVNSQSETSADDDFSLEDIYTYFGPNNCPALLNKPKIIIIQACRGGDAPLSSRRPDSAALNFNKRPACVSEEGGGIVLDDLQAAGNPPSDDANIQDDKLRVVHKEKDFISLLCCTPGE